MGWEKQWAHDGRSAHNFFLEKMGSSKKKIMGSAHFLAVRILGAHDPYIPTGKWQETIVARRNIEMT